MFDLGMGRITEKVAGVQALNGTKPASRRSAFWAGLSGFWRGRLPLNGGTVGDEETLHPSVAPIPMLYFLSASAFRCIASSRLASNKEGQGYGINVGIR